MNTIRSLAIAAGLAVGLAGLTTTASAAAPGTSFTYQGVLSQDGSPVNGLRDMRFRLYDVGTGGTPIQTVQVFNVELTGGLFTAEVNFGAAAWTSNDQFWVEIEAGPADQSQSYEIIGRQRLTGTPYAFNTRGLLVDDSDRTIMRSPAIRMSTDPEGDDGVWRFVNSNSNGSLVVRNDPAGGGTTEAMVIDTDGNVGIATSTPDALLTINPETNGNDVNMLGFKAFDASPSLFAFRTQLAPDDLQNAIKFSSFLGPATRDIMTWEVGGDIGFGTVDPRTPLHISDGGAFATPNSNTVLTLEKEGSAYVQVLSNADTGILFGDESRSIAGGVLYSRASDSMKFRAGGNNTRMTLTAGGRLGIGTENPNTTLDINGAVTIRGGADIVEGFDSVCGTAFEPGTVLVIDAENPGMLTCAQGAYDKKVAGVVSGAGGVQPGIKLGQDGVMDGSIPVAMTGRVYVKATAANGAIEPGDLLTTADLAGHAMKATDADHLDGTVIGKAMGTLDSGEGLVLVLVNLQ